MTKCKVCHHDTDDVSHDRCRTHAHCSVNGRYDRTFCSICVDLWQRARDSEDPQDSIRAMNLLKEWISGFARNSRQSKCWTFMNVSVMLYCNELYCSFLA